MNDSIATKREFTLELNEIQLKVLQRALEYTAEKRWSEARGKNSYDKLAKEINDQIEEQ